MRGKKVFLLLFSLAMLGFLFVSASAAEEYKLSDMVEPLKSFDLGAAYEEFPFIFDLVIYFLFFISLAQVTLGKQFQGSGGRGLVIAAGLALAVAMTYWAYKTGFILGRMGALAALLFAIVIAILIYRLLKGDEKVGSTIWIIIIIFYIGIFTFFPEIVTSMQENDYGRLALAFGAFLFMIAIPMTLINFMWGGLPGGKDEIGKGLWPSSESTRPRRRGNGRAADSGTGGGNGGGGTGNGNGGGGAGRHPRPPGRVPPPTPPRRHPTDPPTPGIPPPGENPHAPVIPAPMAPKKPKIPDDKKIFTDLSPYFNGIRSQDKVGACTAFAATSIFEYIFNVLRTKNAGKYLSPLFLYYHSRKRWGQENVDSGVSSSLAIDTLHREGVCFEELWTFEHLLTGKFSMAPTIDAERDAVSKKIAGYWALDMHDPDQWVYELLNHNPCYISINVPNNFNGTIYTNYNPVLGGGHGMVIVGYHSHYPYKGRGIKAFKLRNSWDVSWGQNGYIWVPADILVKLINTGVWVLKGWKKDDYKKLGETDYGRLLERIKEYAGGGEEWLAAQFKWLEKLKGHIQAEDYERAAQAMAQAGNCERKSNRVEAELEKELSELIAKLPQPHKAKAEDIKHKLDILGKEMVKLTSKRRGSIQSELKSLMNLSKDNKDYPDKKKALQDVIDKAIETLKGIVIELDKLINLVELLKKKAN